VNGFVSAARANEAARTRARDSARGNFQLSTGVRDELVASYFHERDVADVELVGDRARTWMRGGAIQFLDAQATSAQRFYRFGQP